VSTQNQKNSIKKLVSLIGVTSASVFFCFPALALIDSNSSSFDSSLNQHTRGVESTGRNRQLLAQGTSGTGQTGTGQTGQTGTGRTGTDQTGTSGAGTCQIGGTTSNNRRANRQQNAFTQYMNAGYAATQQRNYPTALACFQRALQIRPDNTYATQAISNVQSYIQRGTAATPTNQGGAAAPTTTNQGGAAAPTTTNQGGTTAPTTTNPQGGAAAPTTTNQGGTTAPTTTNPQGGAAAPTTTNQGGTTAPTTNPGNR
jgi:hypothetical protein